MAEILKAMPPPLLDAVQRSANPPETLSIAAAAFSASYAGPLPPPEQIKGYEEVLPGSADRILRMAEDQAKHRQHLETVAVEEDNKRSWWGLWLGFIISLIVIGLGAGAVFEGQPAAGAVIMGVDVTALAGVFVYGQRSQRKERETKDQQTHYLPTNAGRPSSG